MRFLSPADLEVAARAIEAGELVAVPTERWYMLCCDAGNAEACARIYAAKRRPRNKPLLLVLRSKASAYDYFQIRRDATFLIEALWPGDLALLLKWLNAEVGRTYCAVGSQVALVCHPRGFLGALAQQTSVLIATTSANISETAAGGGFGPAITTGEVLTFVEVSGIKLAAIVEGGICPQFTHMTIVDCSALDSPAQIVREGTIHRRAVVIALQRGAG